MSCSLLESFCVSSKINPNFSFSVDVAFADDCCKQLLMDCETLAETSANSEHSGNISQAVTDCQQAIG